MDVKLTKNEIRKRRLVKTIGAIAILALISLLFFVGAQWSKQPYSTVSAIDVKIIVANKQSFTEQIALRGTIIPSVTMYLDVEAGGTIERIEKEEGDFVRQGELIAVLTNTNLQLEVTAREAAVSEQVNNLRNTRITIEKETLDLKRDLENIRFEMGRLRKLIEKRKPLLDKKLISNEEIEELEEELQHYEILQSISLERRETDRRNRKSQIALLEATTKRLNAQMDLVRAAVEDLSIKAPMDGALTTLSVEVGQRMAPGDRLGVIDSTDEFEVEAHVPEYYSNRVRNGVIGTANFGDGSTEVNVSKVYPRVSNGQFKIELEISNHSGLETVLNRGQSVPLNLSFGSSTQSIVIPRESFHTLESGDWVYLVNESSTLARLRQIEIGRRNLNEVEVIGGLKHGERILVTSISNSSPMEEIRFE